MIEEFERENPTTHNYYILASKDKDVYKCMASDYGTPQKRERLFIVGCNSKYGYNPFIYPEKTHGKGRQYDAITVEDAFRYLPKIKSNDGNEVIEYCLPEYELDYQNNKITEGAYLYYKFIYGDDYCEDNNYKKNIITYHKSLNHSKKMIQRFENIKQGEGMQSAVDRLIKEGKEDIVKACFPNKIYSSRNRRLKNNEPSYTVTSHCLDEMVHPTEDRQPTPREVARLQGFPDWYKFEGPYVKFHSDPQQDKYEQIGDAIPVIMAKALAKSFKTAIKKLDDKK